MRGRLIELIKSAVEETARIFKIESEECLKRGELPQHKRTIYDIEADYLLANGVIVPPCNFLQKCYVLPTIENGLSEMTEMKCIGFMLSHDSYVANLVNDKNKLYQPGFGRFGKTVFLSREEAEKALRKER